jgi:uncharacterized phage-associated protein
MYRTPLIEIETTETESAGLSVAIFRKLFALERHGRSALLAENSTEPFLGARCTAQAAAPQPCHNVSGYGLDVASTPLSRPCGDVEVVAITAQNPSRSGRHQMTFSPVNVSNNILKRSFDDDISVSPMKLQKLLYFVASEYAKTAKKPLFNEQFQAWDYGPVVRSVYDEFRPFGGGPIRGYAKDAAGKSKMINEAKDEQLRESIDRVWEHAKDLSAVRLSRITHNQGSAWFDTFQRQRSGLISNEALQADKSYLKELDLA